MAPRLVELQRAAAVQPHDVATLTLLGLPTEGGYRFPATTGLIQMLLNRTYRRGETASNVTAQQHRWNVA